MKDLLIQTAQDTGIIDAGAFFIVIPAKAEMTSCEKLACSKRAGMARRFLSPLRGYRGFNICVP